MSQSPDHAPPLREDTFAAPPAGPDWPFHLGLAVLGGVYVVLIVAMIAADAFYTTPGHLFDALQSKEIRYAIYLSLISCSVTTILSLWVAVPLGYLLSRHQFPFRGLINALLDIPIVLPPLVVGLSLLILFQTPAGKAVERLTRERTGVILATGILPLLGVLTVEVVRRVFVPGRWAAVPALLAAGAVNAAWVLLTPSGRAYAGWLQERFATDITYAVPSVILAQFAVAAAFAVQTMRVTFDGISPRCEQVALTLGCTRSQAFWWVLLPEARRGLVTAATLAWARALGEFGPVLVFSGATRLRTEVLPTTVFLELSVGNLHGAVAVSLLMVAAAMAVLVIVRVFGTGRQA
ncbi:MAG: ABC transporter permease [Gemmataceae bacterium]